MALDTVVVAALIDAKDKWHEQALLLKDALQNVGLAYIVFDPVVNETISLLARRLQEQKRSAQVQEVFVAVSRFAPQSEITWISSETRRLYADILDLVREHQGELNFHDALIALVCRELAVEYIVSFDRDFDRIPWLTRLDSPSSIAAIARNQA